MLRPIVRSIVRPLVRSMFGDRSLLLSATSQLNGVAPYHYWDFINNRALFASADVGAVTSTPGWSYTRADAQSAYAETSAGVLVPFATGVLRRTDKGLLIEGARTNLCLQSQTFDNAAWTVSNASVTANAGVAPDGTQTADLITAAASTYTGFILSTNTFTVSASTAYTYSLYVKANVGTNLRLRMSDNVTGQCQAQVNAVTGAVSVNSSGTFSSVSVGTQTLGGGWFRVWITGTQPAGQTGMKVGAYLETSGDSIYFWGAQVE